MKTSSLHRAIVTAMALGLVCGVSLTAARAAEQEVVEFRLVNWKTMEFEDKAKATQHVDAVKKLGCEVKQDDHQGHVDVTYRCAQWKKMSLKSHSEAHQWERWLKASGFETKHTH